VNPGGASKDIQQLFGFRRDDRDRTIDRPLLIRIERLAFRRAVLGDVPFLLNDRILKEAFLVAAEDRNALGFYVAGVELGAVAVFPLSGSVTPVAVESLVLPST